MKREIMSEKVNPSVIVENELLFSNTILDSTESGIPVDSDNENPEKKRLPYIPPDELPEPKLSENAITVLKRRYLKKDDSGRTIESPKEMFWRVARTIAANELRYNPDCDILQEAIEFYHDMAALDFIPNSPTLMNAGRRLGQLSACFVLPVEDSMDGIFETVKNAALVHKSGGGTGFSFSRLRQKSSMVASTAGTASGPVSFMTVFNAATETIKQGGTRRGANMGILRVDHPDIVDFITCKQDMVSITNFNISVAATDKFMQAVENDATYDLVAPHTGKTVRQESARKIFDMIVENAWRNGDPGMIFIDEINRHEKTPHVGLVEATNPCGEQPLLPYESCNLGSINLNNMLTENLGIDWGHLGRVVRRGVRFLDNIVDLNKFPVDQIRKMTKANRRIGLGVMGFADMLYALGIPYNSDEAVELARNLMKFINSEARETSNILAEERGPFPNCEGSIFDHPTRNSTVTTIAPTGTISMIADTSGGVEPSFALVYVKRVMDDDRLLYVNRRFEQAARDGGWYNKALMEKIAAGEHLENLKEIPETARKFFVTAHDISPEWHIRMQAAFQEHTENAVSKTVNFPKDATVDNVKDAYISAWRLKCKGITIYRDGSRDVQVMNVGDKMADTKSDEKAKPVEKQPAVVKAVTESKPSAGETLRKRAGSLKPRHRPRVTQGYTEQIVTGEGTLYVTINEDDQGLCEVFASIGKSGGNAAAQSEAICRLISLALRSGVDPMTIIRQLKGITGANPVWHEGELIRSTPDAIGHALERYIRDRENRQVELQLNDPNPGTDMKSSDEANTAEDDKTKYFYGAAIREQCPDCQFPMIFEEGCMVCKSCGYSKCE